MNISVHSPGNVAPENEKFKMIPINGRKIQ